MERRHSLGDAPLPRLPQEWLALVRDHSRGPALGRISDFASKPR
jgi:hypothetical protein